MARVITPAGLDLGDIQDEALLAYYRGEHYTFPDDEQEFAYGEPMTGVEVPLGETATVSNAPTSLDLSKTPPPVAAQAPDGDEATATAPSA